MRTDIVKKVRKNLKSNADSKVKESARRFFKEKVKFYGVKSAVVARIAKETFREIQGLKKNEVFKLCEILLKSDYSEEAFIAFDWAYSLRKGFEPADFRIFERWIKLYINNWAKCDSFCNHTVGSFIEMYPEFLGRLREWTGSKNRWVRRASAVTLILPARHGKFLEDVFEIADLLLEDEDDLVQKGYGWLLKAASQAHQREVFDFIMENKKDMPRTALRYAIEKMPPVFKEKAMAKQPSACLL